MNDHTFTMSGVRSGFGHAKEKMKLVSVQVGRSRNVQWHGNPVSTGIYNRSIH